MSYAALFFSRLLVAPRGSTLTAPRTHVAATRGVAQAAAKETLLEKFIDQFKQPLILLLFGSALISALLGSYDDAISITLVRA